MKEKKLIYLIGISMMIIGVLYVADQILTLNYLSKIILKFILFSTFPIVYSLKTRDDIFKSSFKNFFKQKNHGSRFNVNILLGLSVFLLILVTYVFLRPFIDTGQLVQEFNDKYEINKSNLVYYSLYLVFINSFIEEFFFRGFIFLNLKKAGLRKIGYFISALLFAVYHISNIQNWLYISVFLLALLGLFVGGLIFNYLDDKEETFLNSWFVHICADLAIVLIGFHIFGIINL
jgi:membrane protease YdiL (CAAX protease family)